MNEPHESEGGPTENPVGPPSNHFPAPNAASSSSTEDVERSPDPSVVESVSESASDPVGESTAPSQPLGWPTAEVQVVEGGDELPSETSLPTGGTPSLPVPDDFPRFGPPPVPDQPAAASLSVPGRAGPPEPVSGLSWSASATPAAASAPAPSPWQRADSDRTDLQGYRNPLPATQSGPSSMGIAAFVVSILSWLACPVVLAVVALVLAAADRRASSDPRQGRGTAGAGLVTAARIIAWVNIAFYAGLLVLLVFFLILAAIAGAATS